MTTTENATRPARKSAVARYATIVTRVLIGLLYTVTGLNGLLNFLPQPEPGALSEGAVKFTLALYETGYMGELAAYTQLIAGVLLIVGRYVPLALALLAPLVVNIFLFHVVLEPNGMVNAIIVVAAEIGLAWAYRDKFRPMLQAR